ncbi:FRAS1-related extracellular matrix protein 2-like [Elysia marginata]|uniref:FRAS1-related extracellular matrix protein 2-like n=1 Tax=Elysia marginata TaxID=1093978 RepID=A0AAV4GQU7_9GAST|nr:FRAS1-related extracellular matrix protein 2-like [Elysia marginata]
MASLRTLSILTTFLGCLLFLSAASAQGTDEAANILTSNKGLVVPLGRSVYVNPEDLQIQVRPGDMCVVTVLDNDPLAQRPGRLMPPSFPCKFGPKDVVYSHFGARNPKYDVIRLQIRYDSISETILIPLTISVEVSFKQLEVLTRNMPITVERLMGISSPIDDSNLEFEFSRGEEQCKLSVLSPISGLPRYVNIPGDRKEHFQVVNQIHFAADQVFITTAGTRH